jgi:phosphohistidine swiveling domain-containing protein
VAVTLFWLRDLAASSPSPAEVGAKARHLALLCAAGLPVPDGFVLTASALRPLAGDSGRAALLAGAGAAAVRLGPTLAVRSSSPLEDRPDGAAPGLFSSRLNIKPDDLDGAVDDVLASAEGPGVRAYLEQRGLGDAPTAGLAVIVQRQVGGGRGDARGVLYTRPPGQPDRDEVWVEAAVGAGGLASTAVARRADGEAVSRDPDFPLSPDELAELVQLGLAAERAIGAGPRPGADVEWVAEVEATSTSGAPPRRLWLVQARPIRVAPAASEASRAGDELAFSRGDPHTLWRWDAAHNPDPLSPAQIGLVDWVAPIAPWPLRVVDGYLYVGSRPDADPHAPAAVTFDDLQARFDDVRAEILRALAPVEQPEPPDLRRALDAYRAVYHEYMVRLSPVLARARASLGEMGAPAPRLLDSAVARAARAGDRAALAALAPVWDVAAATFEERGAEDDVIGRALAELDREGEGEGEGDRAPAEAGHEPLESDLAGLVRTISEADDLLFFRAQRAVRRALLGLAGRWHLSPPDDVFHLPLEQVRASAESGAAIDPAQAHLLADEARAVRESRRRRAAPLAFRDGRAIAPAGGSVRAALSFWRGRGAGRGSARGRVLRVDDLGHLDSAPRGRVIVALSVTPAALIQLAGAAALVCEHGGVLDHAAALARELGLPCVVGCPGVWRALDERHEILVDGDAGLVIRLSGPSGLSSPDRPDRR